MSFLSTFLMGEWGTVVKQFQIFSTKEVVNSSNIFLYQKKHLNYFLFQTAVWK
jgi:hypothetical protein